MKGSVGWTVEENCLPIKGRENLGLKALFSNTYSWFFSNGMVFIGDP